MTGGGMAQMSRPRLWIRYRRPLATSSSTFENERLASVAEIRFGRLSDLRAIDLVYRMPRRLSTTGASREAVVAQFPNVEIRSIADTVQGGYAVPV